MLLSSLKNSFSRNFQISETLTKNTSNKIFTLRPILNYLFLTVILISFFNCSAKKKYDKSQAIDLINHDQKLEIDTNLQKISINIPSAIDNKIWLGSSTIVNQNIENINKKFSLEEIGWFKKKQDIVIKRTWYKNIFYLGNFSKNFVYSPVILDNKIFILDSSGELTSFSLKDKTTLWQKRIFDKLWLKNYKVAHLGACNNKIFAVAGINKIKALSTDDGQIIWEKDLSVIFNSTPICDGELVFISSSDNKTYALNASDGKIQWMHYGIPKSLAIFGNSHVITYQNIAILSYSSGEIYALNKKTGEQIWFNDVNSNQNYGSDLFLSDIDATPLVKDGVAYVIGNGGLMKAISIDNGKEIWKLPISSIINFWLAGDFLYVINNDNKLFAIHKKTSGVKWQVQLEQFRNPKKINSKHNYIAVVMAGGKLLISRQDGQLFLVSPLDGKIEKKYSLDKRILHAPVIIDNKIYFYGMSRFRTKLIELE